MPGSIYRGVDKDWFPTRVYLSDRGWGGGILILSGDPTHLRMIPLIPRRVWTLPYGVSDCVER